MEFDLDTDDRDDIQRALDICAHMQLLVVGKTRVNQAGRKIGEFQPSRLLGRFASEPPQEWAGHDWQGWQADSRVQIAGLREEKTADPR